MKTVWQLYTSGIPQAYLRYGSGMPAI